MKGISCAVIVPLAMIGLSSPALATPLLGGFVEVQCEYVVGGIVIDQEGGLFPIVPVGCNTGTAEAAVGLEPPGLVAASVNTLDFEPNSDRSGSTAVAVLQYDFAVTGGNVGDLVPVLLLAHLETFASNSDDANNANVASANFFVRALSPVNGVQNQDDAAASDCEPISCGQPHALDAELSLTLASGSVGRVFEQVLVAASVTQDGTAFGFIDPYIFVDPNFANAADYTITVADGIVNAPAPVSSVPEPRTWTLVLAGLVGLTATRRPRLLRSAMRF